MTNQHSVVIVGAGQGGFQLAASLRESGYTDAITLVGVVALLAVCWLIPATQGGGSTHVRQELAAFSNGRVLLAMGITALVGSWVGFGVFASSAAAAMIMPDWQ